MSSSRKNSSNKKIGSQLPDKSTGKRPKQTNQKKVSDFSIDPSSSPKVNSQRRHTSSQTLDSKPEYMKKILVKNSKNGSFTCLYCSKEGEHTAFIENADHHVNTPSHEKNTPSEEKEALKKLCQELADSKNKKESQKKEKEDNQEESQYFLKFLAFTLKENYSFLQIASLGKFLQSFLKAETIKMFKSFNFDREIISKITKDCFGECLLNSFQTKLENSKFSFTIDSSTLCGENICALTVKYLETFSDENKPNTTQICNKIIGIQILEESSTAETFKEIVETKLFCNPRIRNNCIGISHDHVASLAGVHKGLTTLLKKDLQRYFFDLPDPCHSLDSVIKKSLKLLPKVIMDFVHKVHNHFRSPQRKAILNKIQREMGMSQLNPLLYIKTRWLSLEASLKRLLQIWESLTLYFTKNDLKEKEKDQDEEEEISNASDSLLDLCNNPIFKLKVSFLLGIIEKISATNRLFQSQSLEIQFLKIGMITLFQRIAKLIFISEKMNKRIEELILIKWDDENVMKEWCMSVEDFLSYISQKGDSKRLSSLGSHLISNSQKKEFTNDFQPFIWNILKLLCKYLPFSDPVIECVDMLNLQGNLTDIENKFIFFNEKFRVIPEENLSELVEEIAELMNSQLYVHDRSNIMKMWDQISAQKSKFKFASEIAKTAQCLPTSSAIVEQKFSTMKLVKSDLRNRLSESGLQALLFLEQEYKENISFAITKEMLEKYFKLKDEVNLRKNSGKKICNCWA